MSVALWEESQLDGLCVKGAIHVGEKKGPLLGLTYWVCQPCSIVGSIVGAALLGCADLFRPTIGPSLKAQLGLLLGIIMGP